MVTWKRLEDLTESGGYLCVIPFFGFVPKYHFLIKVDGTWMTFETTPKTLSPEHIYLGPLPEIPTEMVIPL